MIEKAIVAGVFLALLFNHAAAQVLRECTTRIKPSAAFVSRVNAAALLMNKGDPASQADALRFRTLSEEAANTRWTCSDAKQQPHCCAGIPIEIQNNSGSSTRCKFSVSFPYGELVIKRKDHDNKPQFPQITWQLVDKTGSAPELAFGTLGIEVIRKTLHRVPVDDCKLHGSGKTEFTCKGNGKGPILIWPAEADHLANVYVAGHVDQPDYRCPNVDPLIANAGN